MPNVTTTRTPIPPSQEHPFGIVNQKDIFMELFGELEQLLRLV